MATSRVLGVASDVADAVMTGLSRPRKDLPAWLFYDAAGSRLYEEITLLAEYYPFRAERSIFERQADAIVEALASGTRHPLRVAELGAGTATKTQLLLAAIVKRQGHATYVPVDVSRSAVEAAARRLAADEPRLSTRPVVARHEEAFSAIAGLEERQVVVFLGSSIGNYEGDEAARLLRGIRRTLKPGGALLLGTDLKKDPSVLVRAYDDARGVTAAFNKNVLVRINRELGGRFDPDRFRHVALWNAGASRVEMHLESVVDQIVHIGALDVDVAFRMGERIHTESSVKYDEASVESMLGEAGLSRERTFVDDEGLFALHIARPRA